MHVTKEFMIDGKVVNKIGDLPGIEVFEHRYTAEDEVKLFFVQGNDVVATFYAAADCSQNSGFISETWFTKV